MKWEISHTDQNNVSKLKRLDSEDNDSVTIFFKIPIYLMIEMNDTRLKYEKVNRLRTKFQIKILK